MRVCESDGKRFVRIGDELVEPEEVIDYARQNECTEEVGGIEHFRLFALWGTTEVVTRDENGVRRIIRVHNSVGQE